MQKPSHFASSQTGRVDLLTANSPVKCTYFSICVERRIKEEQIGLRSESTKKNHRDPVLSLTSGVM